MARLLPPLLLLLLHLFFLLPQLHHLLLLFLQILMLLLLSVFFFYFFFFAFSSSSPSFSFSFSIFFSSIFLPSLSVALMFIHSSYLLHIIFFSPPPPLILPLIPRLLPFSQTLFPLHRPSQSHLHFPLRSLPTLLITPNRRGSD